jgi:hypothetical protein
MLLKDDELQQVTNNEPAIHFNEVLEDPADTNGQLLVIVGP